MSGYVNPIPPDYEPVEIVIRHPDFEDDIYQYGLDHRVVYLDLGGSFDVTKIGGDSSDIEKESIREWAEGTLADVADLPADHPARQKVEEQVEEILFLITDGAEPANSNEEDR